MFNLLDVGGVLFMMRRLVDGELMKSEIMDQRVDDWTLWIERKEMVVLRWRLIWVESEAGGM